MRYFKHIQIVACLFILLKTTCLYSQESRYTKGFFVTENKDTVYGTFEYINDYKFNSNPRFYKTNKSEGITLQLKDVILISLENGVQFERLDIKSPKDTSMYHKYVFGKTIIHGGCSLFNITQTRYDEDIQFVIQKGSNLFILTQQQSTDNDKLIKDTRYLGILNLIMSDCDSIKPYISRTSFNEKSLQWIINKYNRYNANKSNQTACKVNDSYFFKGPKFVKKYTLYLSQYTMKRFDIKQDFGFGLGFLNFYHQIKEKPSGSFSVGLKVFYSKYHFVDIQDPQYAATKYTFSVSKYFLDIPFNYNRLYINTKDLILFINFGMCINFSKVSNLVNSEAYMKSSGIIDSRISPDNTYRFAMPLLTGFGVFYKKTYSSLNLESPCFINFSFGYNLN